MRKLTFFFALLFGASSFACTIDPGNIGVEKQGKTYKLFLIGKPVNTCYPTDSSSLRVTVICADGSYYESHTVATTDTVVFEVEGKILVGMSINWLYKGQSRGRTDIPTIVRGNGVGCSVDFTVVVPASEPDISTENPPPAPEFEILILGNNLIVTAPWPGELRVFDSMGQAVHFESFDEGHFEFDCEALSPGLFFLNVLLFRPTGLISETLQIWH
jgi:hypothetical protein